MKKTSKTKTKSKQIYKSSVSAAIHELASGMERAGLLNRETMRSFDASCLTPLREFTPQEIRDLRVREEVSQGVFALHLGVTTGSISQWERGEKRPAGSSLKLLSLVHRKGLEAIA